MAILKNGGGDLYGVYRDLEALRQKTRHPYFEAWWQHFLAKREEALGQPVYPDIPGLEQMDVRAADEARNARMGAAAGELEAQSLAYALTGETRFALKARELAVRVCADDAPWMTPGVHKDIYPELNADLGFATLCINVSLSLGLLWDALSEGDRRLILDTLEARGAVIYGDALRGAWWGDALNSNWTSHLMHGLGSVGLALWHERPAAAKPWVERATEIMGRMLDLAGEEGVGLEGVSYYPFCWGSVLQYATKLRNVTGESLFGRAFWKKCSLFLLYQTLPDLSGRTPLGDSSYPGLPGIFFLSGVAREMHDGLAQWQAHRALEKATPKQIGFTDLVFYDASAPETPPDALPPCKVFPSVQIATFRSGWERDAVYMHFHGGSNTWSHCHLDLNAFTLDAYGERLAIDHGSWGYSDHYFRVVEPQISTAWHNTVVVDGADQRQGPRFRMSYDATEGGDCYALLQQHLACQGIQMIRGDATSAYADMLDRFWREVVYLPPDRFVIYDNLVTNGARTQRHLQWLLHSAVPMTDLGARIEVRGQKAKLVVQPVFPLGWRCRFPDRIGRVQSGKEHPIREAYALSLYPEWIHIWNESPSKPAYPQWDARGGQRVYGPDYQYLVVLTPLRANAEVDWQVERLQGPTVEGVRLTAANGQVDTLLFKRSGGLYTLGDVTSDAEKVVLREADGKVRSLACVGGTTLRFKDQVLVNAPQPTSLARDL